MHAGIADNAFALLTHLLPDLLSCGTLKWGEDSLECRCARLWYLALPSTTNVNKLVERTTENRMRNLGRLVFIFTMAIFAGSSGSAQEIAGSIGGTVLDAS